MTLDAAVGSVEKAMDALRLMVASSTAFQSFVDADDATEADAHVYHDALPEPTEGDVYTPAELDGFFPFAMIYEPQEGSRSEEIAAGTFGWSGVLTVELIGPAELGTPDESARKFRNVIAGVIDDVLTQAGASGCLSHFTIERRGGPARTREAAFPISGDLWRGGFFVRWRGI